MVRFRLGHLIPVVMKRRVGGKSGHFLFKLWALGTLVAVVLGYKVALADESGVSIWLPGTFGSLAAVPVQPGFQRSRPTIMPPQPPKVARSLKWAGGS